MKRRSFIKTGSVLGAALATPSIAKAQGFSSDKQLIKDMEKVNFIRDGLDFTPLEYSKLLYDLDKQKGIPIDSYSRGGVVEELEKRMAEKLGKESAIFMPTGTLANHMAVRLLAGNNRKVLLQSDSHLYRDSGDCANTLSGLNLIPLGKNKVDFDLKEVEEEFSRTEAGRVETQIGVISIETPVRRYNNQCFDFNQMVAISEFAKKNNIKMHLDGARLFNACVHTNKKPEEYAQMFDTVYISLYKDFNAASGAILVGDKSFTNGLYHIRRMFGGGMAQVWPFAAVAVNYLDSFIPDYKESLVHAEKLFALLRNNPKVEINTLSNGSNVFQMKVINTDLQKMKKQLEENNIFWPAANAKDGFIYFKINPSILRKSVDALSKHFLEAIS